jgi:hypothetical protein
MVILPGGVNAASFNDDSSPDTRQTAGQKVSVNAQVIPENSLGWYYKILQLCPSVQGELKSADVWPRFQALDSESRSRIWTGLSKVRIHIVDPTPYKYRLDDILRRVYRWDDPAKVITRQLQSGDPTAFWLSRQTQVWLAENILSDSTGARVHSLSRFLNDGFALHVLKRDQGRRNQEQEEVLHWTDFGRDTKPLVRKVTTWSAKSAATFHEALDCFEELDEFARYSPDDMIRNRMAKRVLKSHAFDKGNQQQIELLEGARDNILDNLTTYDTISQIQGRRNKPYLQLDSTDSYLVQAADIAAGIASKIYESENLVAVASRFEYVTYNGRRVSIADAEEEIRLMRWHRR